MNKVLSILIGATGVLGAVCIILDCYRGANDNLEKSFTTAATIGGFFVNYFWLSDSINVQQNDMENEVLQSARRSTYLITGILDTTYACISIWTNGIAIPKKIIGTLASTATLASSLFWAHKIWQGSNLQESSYLRASDSNNYGSNSLDNVV